MRFLSMVCGILVLLGGVARAQESLQHAPTHRIRPQRPGDFAPDPLPVQNAPGATAQPSPQQTPAAAPKMPAMPSPAPSPPAVEPAPPEQLPPATPPQVTYRNGMLTVQATNSTLSSLLTAIRNKTGIQFEGLENGAPERVAVSMGPAPEGEVLAAILAGSKFDYVVLERPDSPGTVQRVLLTPRGGAAPAATAGPPQPALAANAEGDDEEAPDEAAEQPQDTPLRAPLTQVQPQPQQQQSPPKTPEQLLEELKRMQQQQQQQQQQLQQQQQTPAQNPPTKPPPIPQM